MRVNTKHQLNDHADKFLFEIFFKLFNGRQGTVEDIFSRVKYKYLN